MKTLSSFQQNRQIVQDFTITTLANIPGMFAKLVYVSTLRDLSSGRYEHAGLAALYEPEAVQQALELCHEEIFERILESPLSFQELDFKECIKGMDGGYAAAVAHWLRLETYRMLLPEHSPEYLKELFCSNLRALLEILQSDVATARLTS